MTEQYQNWIAERLSRLDSWNQCEEWTLAMMADFPELKRVRGYVFLPGMERPHWWLVDPAGEIVDPTRQQFYDKPGDTLANGTVLTGYYGGSCVGGYEPVDESNPPIGKCCNCGGTCYQLTAPCSLICSLECDAAYRAYLMRELPRLL